MRKFKVIIVACFLVFAASSLFMVNETKAASVSWDGGGGNDDWCTDANWSNDSEPTSSDDVTIDAVVTVTTDGCITEGNPLDFNVLIVGGVNATELEIEQNIGTGGNITIANNGTIIQFNTNTQVISGDLIIQSGGLLKHEDNSTSQAFEVDFSAANIDVQLGGSINVYGLGYDGGNAPQYDGYGPSGLGGEGTGASNWGGGGGAHYGAGGEGDSNGSSATPGGTAYDSATNPVHMGAGGGSADDSGDNSAIGGAGGGYISLTASGTVTVNGTISANGRNPWHYVDGGGGGGGGTIKIIANTVAGVPQSLSAKGGNASNAGGDDGGGGGGGIVYVGYSSSTSISSATVDGGTANGIAAAGGLGMFTAEQLNSVPTVVLNSVVQKTDGSGGVDISVTFDDADNNDTLKAKVEYKSGIDCSSGTSDPNLDETTDNVSATYVPKPTVENDNEYQVGDALAWILTSSGANTITFDWDSTTDVPAANGTYCLKVTPHDGSGAGINQATTFTLDNVDPSGLTTLDINGSSMSTIDLSWSEVTETNFDHYEVWFGTSQSDVQNRTGAADVWNQVDDGDLTTVGTTSTTITGLTSGVTYFYKIWAVDAYGNEETVDDLSGATDPARSNLLPSPWLQEVIEDPIVEDEALEMVEEEVESGDEQTDFDTPVDSKLPRLVKTADSSTVYQINEDGSRSAFVTENHFFEYYDNFKSIEVISSESMEEFVVGLPVPSKAGGVVKFETSGKVYVVGEDNLLTWISTQAKFYELGYSFSEVSVLFDSLWPLYKIDQNIIE